MSLDKELLLIGKGEIGFLCLLWVRERKCHLFVKRSYQYRRGSCVFLLWFWLPPLYLVGPCQSTSPRGPHAGCLIVCTTSHHPLHDLMGLCSPLSSRTQTNCWTGELFLIDASVFWNVLKILFYSPLALRRCTCVFIWKREHLCKLMSRGMEKRPPVWWKPNCGQALPSLCSGTDIFGLQCCLTLPPLTKAVKVLSWNWAATFWKTEGSIFSISWSAWQVWWWICAAQLFPFCKKRLCVLTAAAFATEMSKQPRQRCN